MLIMEYNITLGDPSGDGHACTSEYHIVANHSVDSEAYKKTTKELGFDYVEEVGADYQAKRWIPEEYTTKLLELGIIDREEIFSFEFKRMVSSKFYCWMKTGYDITVEKLEKNERKED